MAEHELTREEAKALANDLYHCYLDLKDPGPNFGRSNEWDSLWVDKIIAFVEDQTAALRAEREALKEQWTKTNAQYESSARAVTRLTGEVADLTRQLEVSIRNEQYADVRVQDLTRQVAHYDRWLEKGVYFTNEEFTKHVDEWKAKLAASEQALKHSQENF